MGELTLKKSFAGKLEAPHRGQDWESDFIFSKSSANSSCGSRNGCGLNLPNVSFLFSAASMLRSPGAMSKWRSCSSSSSQKRRNARSEIACGVLVLVTQLLIIKIFFLAERVTVTILVLESSWYLWVLMNLKFQIWPGFITEYLYS